MKLVTVFRIQDANGRGPFRPGLTTVWLDPDRTFFPPAIMDEFNVRKALKKKGNFHIATATATQTILRKWFSRTEYDRLRALGYKAYEVPGCGILDRSKIQMLVCREFPFWHNVREIQLY